MNENALATLRGNTHPLAQAQYDQGIAPPDLPMARMLLVLKRSDAQESTLQALLDAQQDPNSPGYHQWLTPDAFGQQFGPSDQGIQAVATWLTSHGFQVGGISRGRTVIEFSGTAAQVQQAFHTEIHKYVVNGEQHWANASDPQIPAALAPVITGINSLHNFSKKPVHRVGGVYSKTRATGEVKSIRPAFTYQDFSQCEQVGLCYFVGP
ncbi:MAG TPA: protease pro-enzyme activation domain-containing protein, partial [Candidatus Acidoferrales bacterium]|nr:protease pro-enzyme activation domain-containing protein [Candidatus Acidoferrales bacterium]